MNDPTSDTIGWEGGYWHDEPLPSITEDDGLNRKELDIVTARAMARVEYIRQEEFTEPVTAEVQSREEYQENNPFNANNTTDSEWNNQVWEALFIVDDPTDVSKELEKFYSGGVVGYYAPSTDKLIIVSDSPKNLTVSEATLVHELTHALQDQRINLSKPKYSPSTQDEQLASNGLIEGEAKYIEQQYKDNCNTNWKCLPEPTTSSTTNGNVGIQLIIYQPYADGPEYISHLIERGGWEAVDNAFKTPPSKSRNIIHDSKETADFQFESRPTNQNGWTTFKSAGDNGTDSAGEASVFTMFWYQNYQHNINIIPHNALYDENNNLNYSHSISNGLVDDQITPYENGSNNGYVWQLHWETTEDAADFVRAYETTLKGHGATEQEGYWRIESTEYQDTFYVDHSGQNVTIVNAPSQKAVTQIYGVEPQEPVQNPQFDFSLQTVVSGGISLALFLVISQNVLSGK